MEEIPPEEPKKKTSLGMEENVEALLAYVLGWLTGILFLVLEKESDFVRFHAMQSTITFIGLTIIWIVLWILGAILSIIAGPLGLLFTLLGMLVWLAWLVFLILGILKAYQGEYYKFPIFGNLAEKWVGKINI
ncbi:Hypothetical membrane protein, conserved [Thermococcus onnurineus NA1]|uniref:Hypothetical membrane protein, conserved n=1 Tax=Thermococcus onnurineus (strain NA1) TaxID=523850 RepID=B6YUV6_THEON|nr:MULTISPECIES: DUF4870 domain-containing protein [Thermococcus]ACJ16142.1 Hypothetical membrane protein, conserved [Thermococcus onnurineus NA1]NJE47376.1 DUF4870 domain-containing protein [Thermococcus sp. GR7]NJE78871.1 DUF4870 domain-containing protein [Thermococcus sp. GR4]NJF23134.1 DUF4870 domain-containing protein [Thermococcus sp. GR5]